MAKQFSVNEFAASARRSSGSVGTVIVDSDIAAFVVAPKPAPDNTAAQTAVTSRARKDASTIATGNRAIGDGGRVRA